MQLHDRHCRLGVHEPAEFRQDPNERRGSQQYPTEFAEIGYLHPACRIECDVGAAQKIVRRVRENEKPHGMESVYPGHQGNHPAG